MRISTTDTLGALHPKVFNERIKCVFCNLRDFIVNTQLFPVQVFFELVPVDTNGYDVKHVAHMFGQFCSALTGRVDSGDDNGTLRQLVFVVEFLFKDDLTNGVEHLGVRAV